MNLSIAEAATTMTDRPVPRPSARKPLLWAIYLVSLALLIWFVVDGHSYYRTPYAERPHHEAYRALRPAGSTGLLFGYVGSAMMILMLIYSVRKRTRLFSRAVSLQTVLDVHIYLGIMGPLLIVLHTSFKVQGLVAVAFWSMAAVAVSGFFGRYLYLQIPRNIQGSELTLVELERINAEMTARLQSRFKLDGAAIERLEQVTAGFAGETAGGAWRSVGRLLADDLFRFRARRQFARRVMRKVLLPKQELHEFTQQSFARAILSRRVALLSQIHQVFHYWHVIHKPFAIIMYVIMLVHIGVAIWTGYGWAW
jgi:hypothetical protein